jgi:glucokinase
MLFVTAQSPSKGGIARRTDRYCVGVEVGPALIRAGVFASNGALVGKTKFSTKIERGAGGVIPRIEKCIRYAVDECDLLMEEIVAIGVGVPGRVSEETGLVTSAPQLAWRDVMLGPQLEDDLDRPVAVANSHNLGALGVYSLEAKSRPTTLAAIFLGPLITGGFIADGNWENLEQHVAREVAGAALDANILGAVDRPEFEHYRSRDFRKALRRGNEAVRAFALEIAAKAGEVAAALIDGAAPETIVIGGGMLDEMRDDLLRIVRDSAVRELNAPWPDTTSLVASSLGDLAPITGAGIWASRMQMVQSKTTALAS